MYTKAEPYDPLYYKPVEAEGYVRECMSWHEGCYIHSGLNPFPEADLEGPDVEKLLAKYFVNSFANRPVGKGMHGIMCNDQGKIVSDGILVKTGEQKYRSLCLPYLGMLAQNEKDLDLTVTELTGTKGFYQFCGPRSLELMENVTCQDLHGLKFMHFVSASIDDLPVFIFRVGMAGTLGYEIHFEMKDADAIYRKVAECGENYGLVQLGRHAYNSTHTEGGFTQCSIHFMYADFDHANDEVLGKRSFPAQAAGIYHSLYSPSFGDIMYDGSYSDQPYKSLFRTPAECGWARMVKFDHDFLGRAAIEKEQVEEDCPRQMVTLEWNGDDVVDVFASLLRDGEPYRYMDIPEDLAPYAEQPYNHVTKVASSAALYYSQDIVNIDGRQVGVSSGRMYSPFYRKVISLCTIERDAAIVGNDVKVIWGNPGTNQRVIRARVAPFPYVQSGRNEKISVADIPSGVPVA